MEERDRRYLRSDLLKRVSRSFYLSMRFLPGPMRGPISLGYLLARASDTLADTAAAPGELRRACLTQFRASLSETQADFPEFYARVMRDFAPHQTHEGERELLQRLPEVFEWLAGMSAKHRPAVVTVLEEITTGQDWDLEHFGKASAGKVAFCKTAEELETYTWRVAGCVGEFWTRIGFDSLGGKFAPAEAESDLMACGRALGQGLQLVNILRDLGEDLGNGRCYLPLAAWQAAGWEPQTTGPVPPDDILMTVASEWQQRCRQFLAQGHDYVKRLKKGRVRFATALPLILAEATLDRIELAGDAVLREKIKISRTEVRRAMWRAWLA